MEQEIVQCHDIAAAEEICFDFQRKTATYSEPDFRVNMFVADTSCPLARPQNTRTLTVLGWTDDTRINVIPRSRAEEHTTVYDSTLQHRTYMARSSIDLTAKAHP